MSSAGHCGRHDIYRCRGCEKKWPDDYHGDGNSATELKTRIALLEAVAGVAVQFWTRDDVYVLDELENALRAAGYLKEQEE